MENDTTPVNSYSLKKFLIHLSFAATLLNIYDFIIGYIVTKNTSSYEERIIVLKKFYLNLISPVAMNSLLIILSLISIVVLALSTKGIKPLRERLYTLIIVILGVSFFMRILWWFVAT